MPGILQIHTNRILQGVRECERALELDRNLAHAQAEIGAARILLGQADSCEAHIQEALRLSPRDTLVYLWCFYAGWAKGVLGKDDGAGAWLRRSAEANGNFPLSHFFLGAALALLGQLAEARFEAQAGLAINPALTAVAQFRAGRRGERVFPRP